MKATLLKLKQHSHYGVIVLLSLLLTGCITTGTALSQTNVNQIQRGITSEAEIRQMFGEPVTLKTNQKQGWKRLTYGYKNDDSIKKVAAGTGGAVVGGALGSQIGGGSGSAIAGSLGAIAGGFLASNAVTARREEQYLEVYISLNTGRVSDFNYIEEKSRSQKIGVSSGVNPL
ncbi:hypothetical protein [Ostreibacterium oceani]|uniref:Outer membrane lipoprotein SlyB n=1 Tax=Ostreibacterium oceani TaxID=2654998 RepID=A0A6N7EWI1_9GAMM|nr:hypothetical protein [Ostreibacterium oceani]MPV85945.1 hypothetical protein [Ostreibacterium oceani]